MTATVEQAVAAIGRGEMVIVVDHPRRENEGDLVIAAQLATPDSIDVMARDGRGLVCCAMDGERLRKLSVPPMTATNTARHGTAFHVGVDARHGTTTGISARDRALAVRALADPATVPEDLAQPGHVFPLAARPGGVLERAGHTEAAVDLVRMAGLEPAAAICEVAGSDGEMARLGELARLGRKRSMPVIAVSDLIAYRRRTERLVERVAEAQLPLTQGQFRILAYRDVIDGHEHVAVTHGRVEGAHRALARVQSACLTGEALGSLRCDCGDQLTLALDMIAAEGAGVVVYLTDHEGRGIGLAEKVRAYALQDGGLDTVDANLHLGHAVDGRDYAVAAQILSDLDLRDVRLLTNNPAKRAGLERYGAEIAEQVPLVCSPCPRSARYLETKLTRMGHRAA